MKKKTLYIILIIIFIIALLSLCTIYYLKNKETTKNINISSNSNKEIVTTKDNLKEENQVEDAKEEIKEDTNLPEENKKENTKEENQTKEIEKEETESITQSKIILIEDKSEANSGAAIEYYYEDSNYKYYFTCVKSSSVFVTVNKVKYTIKEALNSGIVTMEELEENGFKPLKEDKKTALY